MPPGRGTGRPKLWRGKIFWFRVTTASAQSLHLSDRFFHYLWNQTHHWCVFRLTLSDEPGSTADGDCAEAERTERREQAEVSERPPRLLVRLVVLLTVPDRVKVTVDVTELGKCSHRQR